MTQKLFVGGLPYTTTTEALRELFGQLEGVASVTVVTDRETGQSRGFGFVEMTTPEAAEAAVRKFNGYSLGGRTLKVELSKPSTLRGTGSSFRPGGGYRRAAGSGW
jgi:RNA recognition motif-containing protein